MGHLVVMDDSEAQFALTAYSRRLWTERAAGLPADVEDDPCGTLWVAADDEEMAHVGRKAAYYEARGEKVEVLDAAALARGRAAAAAGPRRARCACRATVSSTRRQPHASSSRAPARTAPSVELGVSVEALEPGRVRCGDVWREADLVLNAAGPEAPRLTPGLPIVPRKGHLVITDRYPGFLRHQVVELGYLKSAHTLTRESVAFNVQPRRTGQLLVGSSRELVGWDASINRALRGAHAPTRRGVPARPRPASSAIRSWIGFRPATPDKLPLVGAWEKGLWVAAGHEGLGVTTATGTARLLADLVLGRRRRSTLRPSIRGGRCRPMTDRVRLTVDGPPFDAERGREPPGRALERRRAAPCARP